MFEEVGLDPEVPANWHPQRILGIIFLEARRKELTGVRNGVHRTMDSPMLGLQITKPTFGSLLQMHGGEFYR